MAQSRPNRKRKQGKRTRSYSSRIERLSSGGDIRQLRLMNIELHGEPIKKLNPKVEAFLRRSLDLLRAGKGAEAEALLNQALEIEPNDPALLNNLGQAYDLQGQWRKAEDLAYEIHERFPDYLFGRTNLATILAGEGEIERAKELIEPLFSRKSLHFGEFSALCSAQIQLSLAEGNREAAESWLDMMKQVIPDDPNIPALEMLVRPLVKALLRTMLRR
jgi:tetratricopeptide (TPR) repeat protein